MSEKLKMIAPPMPTLCRVGRASVRARTSVLREYERKNY